MKNFKDYNDFLDHFDVEEYLSDKTLWQIEPKVREKYEELQKAKEERWEVGRFQKLGCGFENAAGVEIFYINEKYAYNTSRYGRAYARIYTVLYKDTGVTDARGHKIMQDRNGTYFVKRFWGGTPECFSKLMFDKPCV